MSSTGLLRSDPYDISALQALFQVLRKGGFVFCLIALFFAGLTPAPAHADEAVIDTPSNLPIPRWAMLRRNEVYARRGPSKDNAVVWTYHAVSLPVQIISETREWRLICDPDGSVAWISRTMLQGQKTVMSPATQKLAMRKSPDETSDIRAYVRPRAIASLDKCKKDWCRISVDGQTGWVPKQGLWGTQDQAACKRPDPFAVIPLK
ncbi:MAG: SH3 domain-containing protein [Asticcacaulis sp.]